MPEIYSPGTLTIDLYAVWSDNDLYINTTNDINITGDNISFTNVNGVGSDSELHIYSEESGSSSR